MKKMRVFFNLSERNREFVLGDYSFRTRGLAKAGYRIGRINAFIKHREGRLSLWKTIRKKRQYGKTLEKYQRKHPNEAKQQFRFIRSSFVKNWRKLVRDPIHSLGMFFMKACEFGATWLGTVAKEYRHL
jgi:hypothetical protein